MITTFEALEKIERDLEDFEWLKSVIGFKLLEQMPDFEDKMRLLKILGLDFKKDIGEKNE